MSTIPKSLRDGLVCELLMNGNANDTSGNGNDGTVSGATLTTDMLGRANRAYLFNNNDSYYIRTPEFEPTSIAIWFKNNNVITTSNAEAFLVEYPYSGAAGQSNGIRLGTVTINATNEIVSIIDDGNSNLFYWNSSTISSISAEWHHMVFVWNGTNYNLYYDGEDKGTAIVVGSPNKLGSKVWDIGRYSTIEWDGKIESMIFWNRALTQAEIQQLYIRGIGTGI